MTSPIRINGHLPEVDKKVWKFIFILIILLFVGTRIPDAAKRVMKHLFQEQKTAAKG